MKTPVRLLIASLVILTLAKAEAQEIHIKARFIELPGSAAANLYLGSFNAANVHPAPDDTPQPTRDTINQSKSMVVADGTTPFTGIMTESQFQTALHVLESKPGVQELAEPEVTTSSGRQTEMRATQIITVVTNFAYREVLTNSAITPQTEQVECGPVLDIVAIVLSDGYAIDLKTTASLKDFLGYDTTTNSTTVVTSTGAKVSVPTILPSLRVRQASAHVKLWDGQTVVLGGLKKYFYVNGKSVSAEPDYFLRTKATRGQSDEENKEVLAFITVTLVDPAGNRIHSDEDMPFAKGAIPPQDGP